MSNGNKSVVMAKVMTWAMVMVMRLVATKRARAWAARAIVMTMRVMGNGEGKGGKAMATATRVVEKWTATVTKRAMAAMTRLGGTGGGDDQSLYTTG